MNAEKELLLALLIEKYTSPKPPKIDQPIKVIVKKKRTRRPNKQKTHKWTIEQKEFVWDSYLKNGYSFESIAKMLGHGLRAKQVGSMYANLVAAKRRVSNG